MRRRLRPVRHRPDTPTLITGGAGFIGTNVAARIAAHGGRVRILDSLARDGVDQNAAWLIETFGDRIELLVGDVRDYATVASAIEDVGAVFHFAAQVAVTASLVDPVHDFGVNAGGTLNLLEALRTIEEPPSLLFTSTNKVYGDLEDVELAPGDTRYMPADTTTRMCGISESRSIEFHSPYGCSKGAADQYVLDYARTFGLPAAVFRMSCIYGPHQFGNEDQGWVAHFLIRALDGVPITIYGDGLQVRDVLFVDDLVDAMLLAHANIERLAGEAFNIGGGVDRTTSLVELLDTIGQLNGCAAHVEFDGWREADQRYYVSDTRKFTDATGWRPTTSVDAGVRALYDWLKRTAGEKLRASRPSGGELVESPASGVAS